MKREAFDTWVLQSRLKNFDQYSQSEVYENFLSWHSSLAFPFSEKFKNQKYSYHQFLFYLSQIREVVSEKEVSRDSIVTEIPVVSVEEPVLVKKKQGRKKKVEELSPVEVVESVIQEETKPVEINHIFTEKECFEQISNYTESIANAKSNDFSLLISGDPGLGKSFEVESTLKKILGEKVPSNIYGDKITKRPSVLHWLEGPTKIPPKELYIYLWKNNGRVILFDDADDIFDNNTSVNILKKILESKEKRFVSYGAKPIILKKGGEEEEDIIVPNEFLFYGRVIVITNRYFHQINDALKSRSLVCEVNLPPEECLKRLERLKSFIIKQVENSSARTADEVIQHLKSISHLYTKLDLRTFKQALEERIRSPNKWKRLVERSIFLKNK